MCMVRDDSPRTNYVTSLITFYLRLGLFRRFWRRTERTLECSKCLVEYLQHFCYVLRFAPTLRFTLWFVHKTFEVVRSVPAININKICKKNPSITNQSIIVTRQSAIGFFFLMDEQFHPIMWFLKRKLHFITVGETGSETTASTANEKRKTSLPLRQYTDIYCSCSRRETFSFQLFSMTTKCVHFYGQWPNPAKNLLVVLMPTIHTIYCKYMLWFNVFWLKLYFPFY